MVGTGSDIESGVLTTAALVDLGVANFWAKAVSGPHRRILERVGAHHVAFPRPRRGPTGGHVVVAGSSRGQKTERFPRAGVTDDYPAPVLRFRMLGVAVAVLAAACGGGGGDGDDGDIAAAPSTTAAASPTTTAAPTTVPATTLPASDLTLRITDVRLANSEESDNGVRIVLPAGVPTASVTVTGLPSPNRVVSVCQANDLDRRLTTAACRMPVSGEAVNVALGSAATGVEIVHSAVSGSGPAGSTTTLGEITIRYSASSREVSARLSQIAAGESGARPTFALTPVGGGAYRATLTWTVIQVFGGTPSSAQLELLQGGNVANKAEGGGLDVRLSGEAPASAGDAAIRVQNLGSSALVSPKLALLLP